MIVNSRLLFFLDVAKAFDSVNHKFSIIKLEHYGKRGVTLSWFKDYLSNRLQYISVNNDSSNYAPIPLRVPQGSILGSILFLLYVNYLPKSTHFANFVLNADDTTTLFKHENLNDLFNITNSILIETENGCKDNKLALNYKKTLHVVFSQRNIISTNDYKLTYQIMC